MKEKHLYGLATTWGFAEATLFFFVPDVLLSVIALERRRQALIACVFACCGALIGGTTMYVWGQYDLQKVLAILDWIPAISPASMETVGHQLEEKGPLALFLGPLTGTPYKIYAARAATAGIGLLLFLLISIPARLIRFLLISYLVAWISKRWLAHFSGTERRKLLLMGWTVFYGVFFVIKSN